MPALESRQFLSDSASAGSTEPFDNPLPVADSERPAGSNRSAALGQELLTLDSAVELTSVTLPSLARAVRCEATLLFADLHGYTALTEERDVEEVAAALGAIKQRALRIVRAHGGIVNQFVGDEIMAFFGFPSDKDDAPRRAVEAALELHALLRSGSWRSALSTECPLCLHSGIDAGLVLLRTHDVRNGLFELTGSAVNRAARLRSAAGSDEIFVSQRVHARIAPFFYTEQLCERRFKGIAEPSTPYLVLASRHTQPPPLKAATQLQQTRSELSDLSRFWHLRRGHAGGAMFVQGAAGSGKTRLLSSFGAQLQREGVTVWHLCCRAEDCRPFSALSPLTATVPQACGLGADEMAEMLIRHLGLEHGPHMFLIDDLQWLDSASRAVLLTLCERLFAEGHSYVCAVRDDDAGREALERFCCALPAVHSAILRLGPLSPMDAEALVVDYLGLAELRGTQSEEQLRLLSDGTPLGLVSLLELILEHKLLQPLGGSWQIDIARLQHLKAASSAPSLIEHRLRHLPLETTSALRALAVLRGSGDVPLLLQVAELGGPRLEAALDDACVARLIELDADGSYRFTHDSIQEAVLAGLSVQERCGWHQRVVIAMEEHPGPEPLYSFELARHSAAGTLELDPLGSFERLHHAGHLALAACDDALALAFLKPAERAAQCGGLQPTAAFYKELAEASLRLGELELAYRSFETALERAHPGVQRAHCLGRMAWIKHHNAEAAESLRLLDDALRQAGHFVPRASVRPLAGALVSHVSRILAPARPHARAQQDAEMRCELYYEAARIWRDNGQPLQALTAAVLLSSAAAELPQGRVRVRAQMTLAFFLQAVSANKLSRKLFDSARSSAQQLADPVAIAFCHQASYVLAAWAGHWEDAEREARACVVERRQYMELGELCAVSLSMYMIESCRGRETHALNWLEHAIDRALERGHAPAMFALVEDAACVALISAGRADEVAQLKRRLKLVCHAALGAHGVYKQLSFQQRLQHLMALPGSQTDIEALLAEFAALHLSPRRVHLAVVGFYLQVAHLRADQCLRASQAERVDLLLKLERALADVEACSRLPVIAAHAAVLRASYEWLCAHAQKSERLLRQAEELARKEFAPWVSYAAARLRAHMLRAAGNGEAALAQAKLAVFHAQKYGQHNRMRMICEEFELSA